MRLSILTLVVGLVAFVHGGAQAREPEDQTEHLYRESEQEVVYRVTREAKSGKAKSSSECRYKKGPWEDCEPASNTQTRTLTLKRGEEGCDQTKVMTKKCKKACRYEKGEWSECSYGTRTRTDMLKAKSDAACEVSKVIKRPCKAGLTGDRPRPSVAAGVDQGGKGAKEGAGACRYDRNTAWTSCDPIGHKKSKVMKLTDGSSDCPPTKTLEKNCRKPKGQRDTQSGGSN